MLPIGIIIALALSYFVALRGKFFPEEFLIVLVVIFPALAFVRLMFLRPRNGYWRDQREEKRRSRIARIGNMFSGPPASASLA